MRVVSNATYGTLKSAYGSWSSWAVWNPVKVGDLSIFEPLGAMHPFLRADLVYVGLNASRSLTAPWFNFHDGRQGSRDFILARTLNNAVFGGGYMTDIIKEAKNSNGADVSQKALTDDSILKAQAHEFCSEMAMLGASSDTRYIIFGKAAKAVLDAMLAKGYLNGCGILPSSIIAVTHYSAHVSEADFKKELWDHIGIFLQVS